MRPVPSSTSQSRESGHASANGACGGFSLAIDSYHAGIDAFVDEDVPILQERGPFRLNYE